MTSIQHGNESTGMGYSRQIDPQPLFYNLRLLVKANCNAEAITYKRKDWKTFACAYGLQC